MFSRFFFALPALMLITVSATAERPSCISVEVDGSRSPGYECLSQLLTPAQKDIEKRAAQISSESIAEQSSNALGLFNRAATQTRMGRAFGHSVTPHRPAPVPQMPPLLQ